MNASKAIYHGMNRAARRRLEKDLSAVMETEARLLTNPALRRLARGHPPMPLLAHGKCGKAVTECTCIDADGKPVEWGLARAMA